MAGIYVVCLILSSIMSGLYLLSLKKNFRSAEYQNLNTHLSLIGLFWSDSRSEILSLKHGSIERDQTESINSFLRVALIACFTSMIGCLFLALFIFSVKVLAKPRLEKKIFASRLTQNSSLSLSEITDIVLNLKAEFGLKGLELT